ncbi:MAG: hypothetical protein K6G48_04130 [Acholeplasmatales bacterium]|nr:hypothetical protein [Acholeplasmatales bacterium]
MKLNQRIYDYALEEKLIERQEITNERSVEIYSLNEYQDIYTEFTNQGKFAVWSCVDGKNYRLFVEDGYYKKLEPLYKQSINQIWLDFWDECDKAVSKFRNVVMPIMLVAIIVLFLGGTFLLGDYPSVQLGVAIGVAVVFIGFVLFFRGKINKRINAANADAVAKIKKNMGEKTFERLLDTQRSYIDEFFHYDDNNDEEVSEDQETIEDAKPNEIEEPVLEDTTENVDNTEENETK